MSAEGVVERTIAAIEKGLARVAPFRATVDSLSAGKVLIIREGAVTADTQAYARLAGFDLVAGDEVLCINLGRQAVVLGKLQRATPGSSALALPFLRTSGPQPTPAVGVALGTGGSVDADINYGNESGGKITLTAGTTSLTTGTAATITMATARPDQNYAVDLTPASLNAGLNTVRFYAVVVSTTVWEIRFQAAPSSGAAYSYYYGLKETPDP